jgi:UPF0271 protein
MTSVDLNSDLGEGYGPWSMGDDTALLGIVSSANIACGGHAGDPDIMLRTVRTAVERGIAIGAHVAYPDRRGFGRRHVELSAAELSAEILYQLGALEAMARFQGARVSYVKPHGALYNEIAVDPGLAETVLATVNRFRDGLPVLGLPDSAVQDAAARLSVPVVAEGFADRGYNGHGRLVPRHQLGAVLHDRDVIAERAVQMVRDGVVTTVEGGQLPLSVATICVHGDHPDAVATAQAVRAALLAADIQLKPFITG